MAPTNTKGSRRERELVNRLDDSGWFPMRAASSGSATSNDLPDVHAGDGNVTIAIEAKSSSGEPIYVGADPDYKSGGDEVGALKRFAVAFRSIPLIGVRFDREPWAFFHPDDVYDAGMSKRVKKEDLERSAVIELSDLHEVEPCI